MQDSFTWAQELYKHSYLTARKNSDRFLHNMDDDKYQVFVLAKKSVSDNLQPV